MALKSLSFVPERERARFRESRTVTGLLVASRMRRRHPVLESVPAIAVVQTSQNGSSLSAAVRRVPFVPGA